MSARTNHTYTPSRLQMARSRGAISGPLLMILGAWGALIPFIGHSFGYGFTPNNTWHWTTARGWLEVLPGAVTFVMGALLTTTGRRASAMVAGWIAVAAGAWYVVGTVITPWWNAGDIGTPTGNAHHAAWEQLGMFQGLGIVIVVFAALALGRVSVVGLRDVEAVTARDQARDEAARDEADQIDLTRTESTEPIPATNRE